MNGYLSVVVAIHVPYLRHHGRDPLGETPLHTTMAELLVPLLNWISDAHHEGMATPIGVACSAVLLEQLADPVVQKHFVLWMERWLEAVAANQARWQAEGQEHLLYLAQFYLDWGQNVLSSFVNRYRRNVVVALRDLCERGLIEPLLLPATDARMSELTLSAARAQLEVGMLHTVRLLGQRPHGLWLSHGLAKQHEGLLHAAGIEYVVLPPGSLGPASSGWLDGRQVVALTRQAELERHVASPELGYIGDPLYRAVGGGIGTDEPGYRRVSLDRSSVQAGWYDPYHAFQRAQDHAAHFTRAAKSIVQQVDEQAQPPLLVVGYESGYGRPRWFEVVPWLQGLFRAQVSAATMTTPGTYLRQHRPRRLTEVVAVPAPVDEFAQLLLEATHQLVTAAGTFQHAGLLQERLLQQAARELLLAQDGSWHLGQTPAEQRENRRRVEQHLAASKWLVERAAHAGLSPSAYAQLELLEDQHLVFPLLNYRVFENTSR